MAERGDPKVLRLIVILLRSLTEPIGYVSQEEFGRKCGLSQTTVSDYELGLVAPAEEVLQRMARVAGVEWHLVAHLIRALTAVLAAADRRLADPVDRQLLEASLLAVMPLLIEEEAEPEPPADAELLEEAREIWSALERYPPAERWQHLETAPEDACRSWSALARVISEAATAGRAEARELTGLSLLAAARGSEGGKATAGLDR